jgi:hypothetical protein
MVPLRLPDPAYASKTAWRLIALVYALVLTVVMGVFTAHWWMSLSRNAPTLFIHSVSLVIPLIFSFALAAVGWASLGLRHRSPADRRRAWAAFTVATVTLLLLTGGLLLMIGVFRMR